MATDPKLWMRQCLVKITCYSKTPSTLHRFQTKTILFCSAFKKICIHKNAYPY